MARFCSQCGSPFAEDAQFCGDCGRALLPAASPVSPPGDMTTRQTPVAPQPAPPAPLIPESPSSKGRNLAIGVAAALAVVVIGAVAALLLNSGGDGSNPRGQGVSAGTATTAASTTTTVDPAVVKADQEYRGYVEKLENIVAQSTSGRGQVGPLVTGVENGCRVSPGDASQQIRTVIDNRTSILNQLAGQAAAPNPEAQQLHSLLQQALQSSIDADIQYKGWMDYLYADFYYTTPIGCPGGSPPKNSAYSAAREADTRASTQKRQFVDAFNPVATRFGLRTWQDSDF